MSEAELVGELTTAVPVSSLSVGATFRAGGLCEEQVERLTALGGAWPPILVRRADRQVIDGAHRVAAARRLGLARLEAELFDGRPEQAFIEFVRRNVTQGLVLSIAERKKAALRVLHDHPIWSDRRVAELCALSPKTVARLRPDAGTCPSADLRHLDVREGRDQRLRPVRPGSARARVVEALRDQPDASLRTLAAAAGVSPETVRLVRLNLAEVVEAPSGDDETTVAAPEQAGWHSDAALASSEQGEQFLAWFEQTAVAQRDLDWVDAVPLGRIYVVADEARRRSEIWLELARSLEARSGRSR